MKALVLTYHLHSPQINYRLDVLLVSLSLTKHTILSMEPFFVLEIEIDVYCQMRSTSSSSSPTTHKYHVLCRPPPVYAGPLSNCVGRLLKLIRNSQGFCAAAALLRYPQHSASSRQRHEKDEKDTMMKVASRPRPSSVVVVIL